jgi:2-keto-4-pentenoate hydratase
VIVRLEVEADRVTRAEGVIESAAARLQQATCSCIPCEPVRDLLGDTNIKLAYRVQQRLADDRLSRGGRVVGRKIGLTSSAVQQQLGVDQPDFGVLFADMRCGEDGVVPMRRLLQPKTEAEIAFVLSADLDYEALDAGQVRAAVSHAVAALEIVDSRIRDWDITITDTVADNGSSGMFVLGSNQLTLDEFEPADVEMSLCKDGEMASSGTGRACLGDPLEALLWLARTARHYGSPLRAGDVVLSGALGPMIGVSTGSRIVAEITALGQVSAVFS